MPATSSSSLSPALVLLLAIGAGVAAASLYYCQPMLGLLATELQVTPRTIGLVPTLTQLGYAVGILLLAPLGDRYDRRRIILLKAAGLALALLCSGLAQGVASLLIASLAVGLTATMAQDFVPAAAVIAPDHQRGKVVGTVMTGLLLGILLSRVVSGFVAEHWGWRTVFLSASLCVIAIGAAAWRGLPRFAPTSDLRYAALIGSLLRLWRQHRELRRAACAQGLLALGFSAFWSTLAVMLMSRFSLGSTAAGAFGLAGAAGAIAAPLAGRMADRRGTELVARLGAGITMLSFAVLGLGVWLPAGAQLALLVVAAIGFDFGIHVALIAHQTVIYGIDPAARSRLNAVMFTTLFIGMSIGSALGSLALTRWGWSGVIVLSTLSAGVALVLRMLGPATPRELSTAQ
jgi:predicted MFS family arabinose efflux permease